MRSILIGSAYYERIPDVTRDQGQTEKAIAALEEVTRKYPDSEYAQNAKRKIEVARDQLAGKEMAIGLDYLTQEAVHRRDQPLQDRGDAVSDDAPRRRSADAADRGLYGARHRPGGADRRGGARSQFPRQPLVPGRLPAGADPAASSRPRTRAPGSAAPSPGCSRRSPAASPRPNAIHSGVCRCPATAGHSLWWRPLLRFSRTPALRTIAAERARTGHARPAFDPRHRSDRPARPRLRVGPFGADRRDRRRQVDPARRLCAGARRARRRDAGPPGRRAGPGHGDVRIAGRSIRRGSCWPRATSPPTRR